MMKRFLWMTVVLLLSMANVAEGHGYIGKAADSVFVTRALAEARQQKKGVNMPLFFARKFIGRPYVAHTLEVGDDRRVVVNTRQLDCTTLVENVTALTQCVRQKRYTFGSFLDNLTRMRYHNGQMRGYTSRLHYFTEWIVESAAKGIAVERQSPNPPYSALQTVRVNYMSSHPAAYKALREHPEYVKEIQALEKSVSGKTFRYIPKGKIANTRLLREAVHDGDIIAITCKKPGLDIAHLGFAVWRKDGLHLLNASMIHKKVVDEPMTLYQYLQKHPSHTGIRVLKVNGNLKQ